MSEEPRPPEETTDPEDRAGEAAGRVGRALGRFARQARESGAEAAFRERKPEFDRMARQVRNQARAAARAARPHIEHAAEASKPRIQRAASGAAERTARFVHDHEPELRQAANTGARIATSRVGPPFLRPVITAVTDEIVRPRPPRVDPLSPPPPSQAEGSEGASGDAQ